MHSYLHKLLSLCVIDPFANLSAEANREAGWQDTNTKLGDNVQASKYFSSEIKELFSFIFFTFPEKPVFPRAYNMHVKTLLSVIFLLIYSFRTY